MFQKNESNAKTQEYFIQGTTMKQIKSHPQSKSQEEILSLTTKEANRLMILNPFVEKFLFK